MRLDGGPVPVAHAASSPPPTVTPPPAQEVGAAYQVISQHLQNQPLNADTLNRAMAAASAYAMLSRQAVLEAALQVQAEYDAQRDAAKAAQASSAASNSATDVYVRAGQELASELRGNEGIDAAIHSLQAGDMPQADGRTLAAYNPAPMCTAADPAPPPPLPAAPAAPTLDHAISVLGQLQQQGMTLTEAVEAARVRYGGASAANVVLAQATLAQLAPGMLGQYAQQVGGNDPVQLASKQLAGMHVFDDKTLAQATQQMTLALPTDTLPVLDSDTTSQTTQAARQAMTKLLQDAQGSTQYVQDMAALRGALLPQLQQASAREGSSWYNDPSQIDAWLKSEVVLANTDLTPWAQGTAETSNLDRATELLNQALVETQAIAAVTNTKAAGQADPSSAAAHQDTLLAQAQTLTVQLQGLQILAPGRIPATTFDGNGKPAPGAPQDAASLYADIMADPAIAGLTRNVTHSLTDAAGPSTPRSQADAEADVRRASGQLAAYQGTALYGTLRDALIGSQPMRQRFNDLAASVQGKTAPDVLHQQAQVMKAVSLPADTDVADALYRQKFQTSVQYAVAHDHWDVNGSAIAVFSGKQNEVLQYDVDAADLYAALGPEAGAALRAAVQQRMKGDDFLGTEETSNGQTTRHYFVNLIGEANPQLYVDIESAERAKDPASPLARELADELHLSPTSGKSQDAPAYQPPNLPSSAAPIGTQVVTSRTQLLNLLGSANHLQPLANVAPGGVQYDPHAVMHGGTTLNDLADATLASQGLTSASALTPLELTFLPVLYWREDQDPSRDAPQQACLAQVDGRAGRRYVGPAGGRSFATYEAWRADSGFEAGLMLSQSAVLHGASGQSLNRWDQTRTGPKPTEAQVLTQAAQGLLMLGATAATSFIGPEASLLWRAVFWAGSGYFFQDTLRDAISTGEALYTGSATWGESVEGVWRFAGDAVLDVSHVGQLGLISLTGRLERGLQASIRMEQGEAVSLGARWMARVADNAVGVRVYAGLAGAPDGVLNALTWSQRATSVSFGVTSLSQGAQMATAMINGQAVSPAVVMQMITPLAMAQFGRAFGHPRAASASFVDEGPAPRTAATSYAQGGGADASPRQTTDVQPQTVETSAVVISTLLDTMQARPDPATLPDNDESAALLPWRSRSKRGRPNEPERDPDSDVGAMPLVLPLAAGAEADPIPFGEEHKGHGAPVAASSAGGASAAHPIRQMVARMGTGPGPDGSSNADATPPGASGSEGGMLRPGLPNGSGKDTGGDARGGEDAHSLHADDDSNAVDGVVPPEGLPLPTSLEELQALGDRRMENLDRLLEESALGDAVTLPDDLMIALREQSPHQVVLNDEFYVQWTLGDRPPIEIPYLQPNAAGRERAQAIADITGSCVLMPRPEAPAEWTTLTPRPIATGLDGTVEFDAETGAFYEKYADGVRLPIDPYEHLGMLLGAGGEKTAIQLANKTLVVYREIHNEAVLKNNELDTPERRLALTEQLRALGAPHLAQIDGVTRLFGRPALVMNTYHASDRELEFRLSRQRGGSIPVYDISLFTQRSIDSLCATRDWLVERNISIKDLQFLVRPDGTFDVADAQAVMTDTPPSEHNFRVLDQLIGLAREQVARSGSHALPRGLPTGSGTDAESDARDGETMPTAHAEEGSGVADIAPKGLPLNTGTGTGPENPRAVTHTAREDQALLREISSFGDPLILSRDLTATLEDDSPHRVALTEEFSVRWILGDRPPIQIPYIRPNAAGRERAQALADITGSYVVVPQRDGPIAWMTLTPRMIDTGLSEPIEFDAQTKAFYVRNADGTSVRIDPYEHLGMLLGAGGEKTAVQLGNKTLVVYRLLGKGAVLDEQQLDTPERLLALTDQLRALGAPHLAQIDGVARLFGRPALVMNTYHASSHDLEFRLRLRRGQSTPLYDTSLFTQRSIDSLAATRAWLIDRNISIKDLQFLVRPDGTFDLADAQAIGTDTPPSEHNLRVLDQFVGLARENVARRGRGRPDGPSGGAPVSPDPKPQPLTGPAAGGRPQPSNDAVTPSIADVEPVDTQTSPPLPQPQPGPSNADVLPEPSPAMLAHAVIADHADAMAQAENAASDVPQNEANLPVLFPVVQRRTLADLVYRGTRQPTEDAFPSHVADESAPRPVEAVAIRTERDLEVFHDRRREVEAEQRALNGKRLLQLVQEKLALVAPRPLGVVTGIQPVDPDTAAAGTGIDELGAAWHEHTKAVQQAIDMIASGDTPDMTPLAAGRQALRQRLSRAQELIERIGGARPWDLDWLISHDRGGNHRAPILAATGYRLARRAQVIEELMSDISSRRANLERAHQQLFRLKSDLSTVGRYLERQEGATTPSPYAQTFSALWKELDDLQRIVAGAYADWVQADRAPEMRVRRADVERLDEASAEWRLRVLAGRLRRMGAEIVRQTGDLPGVSTLTDRLKFWKERNEAWPPRPTPQHQATRPDAGQSTTDGSDEPAAREGASLLQRNRDELRTFMRILGRYDPTVAGDAPNRPFGYAEDFDAAGLLRGAKERVQAIKKNESSPEREQFLSASEAEQLETSVVSRVDWALYRLEESRALLGLMVERHIGAMPLDEPSQTNQQRETMSATRRYIGPALADLDAAMATVVAQPYADIDFDLALAHLRCAHHRLAEYCRETVVLPPDWERDGGVGKGDVDRMISALQAQVRGES